MDVDTVPIPAEDLGQDTAASNHKQHASFMPSVAATRRRR